MTMRARSGVVLLSAFFLFGCATCLVTLWLLLVPGSRLDRLWSLNPEAQRALRGLGGWAVALMSVVGAACAFAAAGLALRREWGRRLALVVLTVNLAGDVLGAAVRHDPRTLIGLPVGGLMILFLLSRGVRRERSSRYAALVDTRKVQWPNHKRRSQNDREKSPGGSGSN